MKIKRIEILGFKSFVDQMVLDIPSGVTGIVGPNGCGKSNVVDAIRWAMGEQSAKNLRGRAMEDVIFGGSETRKPHGMAEVSIIFDNEDGLAPAAYSQYAEIMVTRRLYRNGDSEYLINKGACRLLDIAELFLDTGVGKRAYSIIEQGKIGQILNAKPEDRRFLIEEAAGVSKFKARKQTAQRKIEATKHNLLRLADIISEVKRHLGSLKRQAQKAERFRQFRDELRSLETAQALVRLKKLNSLFSEARTAEKAQQEKVDLNFGQLEREDLALSEARIGLADHERKLAQVQEQVYGLGAQIQEIEGRLALAEREQQNHARQGERAAMEQLEVQKRLDETEDEVRNGAKAISELLDANLQAQTSLASASAKAEAASSEASSGNAKVEEAQASLLKVVGLQVDMKSQQADTHRRLDLVAERQERNTTELQKLQDIQNGLAVERGQLSQQLASHREHQDKLASRQVELQCRLAELQNNKQAKETVLLQEQAEVHRLSSRHESLQQLERNLEGYSSGVQQLLKDARLASEFQGLVADSIVVSDDLEVAVTAALGEGLQALLTPGPESIETSIALLRTTGGRGSFLLAQPFADISAPEDSVPLLSLLQVKDPRVKQLLSRVFLVDDTCRYVGRDLSAGSVLVDRTGSLYTSAGLFSGGTEKVLSEGVLRRKREMRDLKKGVADGEGHVQKLQRERELLGEEIQVCEGHVAELLKEKQSRILKVLEGDKDISRLDAEGQRVLERMADLVKEQEQLQAEQVRLTDLQVALQDDVGGHSAEQERLEADVARLRLRQEGLSSALEVAREELTACKIVVAGLKEREESAKRSQVELGKLQTELRGRCALLASQQEEAEKEQERLAKERVRLKAELEALFVRHEEIKGIHAQERDVFEVQSAQIVEQEAQMRLLRQSSAAARDELSALQLGIREQELAIEHLCETFQQRYQMDLLAIPSAEEVFDPERDELRIAELKRAIEGVGEVNLTAIEEFQELEERYQFLTTQQSDLKESLEGLQAAIVKINRTTRKRFQEAFEAVNIKFQEVFPRLFRGGRAELRLTDSEDLLESGIDIVAQPPGKKLQNVGLLSGGEKALTAVSLIFAIFLVKPSPFCLLDEVDAPLDDANIGRFNQLVAEMSSTSQFILITHNQRTMKVADTLYGITMEEPGVSKLVSVRLSQFEQE